MNWISQITLWLSLIFTGSTVVVTNVHMTAPVEATITMSDNINHIMSNKSIIPLDNTEATTSIKVIPSISEPIPSQIEIPVIPTEVTSPILQDGSQDSGINGYLQGGAYSPN